MKKEHLEEIKKFIDLAGAEGRTVVVGVMTYDGEVRNGCFGVNADVHTIHAVGAHLVLKKMTSANFITGDLVQGVTGIQPEHSTPETSNPPGDLL